MDYSNTFVCLMGMGIVFFGLISLVILTKIMSVLCARIHPQKEQPRHAVSLPVAGNDGQTLSDQEMAAIMAAIAAASESASEADHQMIAAVSAVIAEGLHTDVTGIRILSMKRV